MPPRIVGVAQSVRPAARADVSRQESGFAWWLMRYEIDTIIDRCGGSLESPPERPQLASSPFLHQSRDRPGVHRHERAHQLLRGKGLRRRSGRGNFEACRVSIFADFLSR